jgi:hypothetical protein
MVGSQTDRNDTKPGSGSANHAKASKAESLQRVAALKQGMAVSSVVAFGAISVLVGAHHVGSTNAASTTQSAAAAPQTGTSTQQTVPGSSGQGTSPSGSQGQGQTNGQSQAQSQGTYGFGSGSTIQPPVAGSGAS